ncbi:MAG: TadE/TadG family type IV pilus assembly protein [Janthinobacterium lividum]
MSANNSTHRLAPCPGRAQDGVAAIEFALLALLFFTLVFGTFEVARLMYVYNTLHVVTHRVAQSVANVYPLETTRIDELKRTAMFRDSAGELVLAPPVSDTHIRIEYFALTRTGNSGALNWTPIKTTALPPNAAQHRQLCMNTPNAANCVRLIQVRICDPADSDNCQSVRSRMMLPLIDLRVPLHKATSIATPESFGYVPGATPCPC